MCYTFIQNQELGTGSFIMSTKRATKKFAALVANSRVAVLVHDFHSAAKTSAEDSSDSSAPPLFGDEVLLSIVGQIPVQAPVRNFNEVFS
jgi:hypothetical protein